MHVTILVVRKRGVLVFIYKNSLPIIIRGDLTFDECIVAELRFGRKNIFFTVLYRNPGSRGNPEFFNFIDNFRDLHSNISSEKPYLLIFTGDFNAHSVQWWPIGDSNNEVRTWTYPTDLRTHSFSRKLSALVHRSNNLLSAKLSE